MKTKLFIAFLIISSIIFAQKKNKTKLNTQQKITAKNSIKNINQNVSYLKFDELKGKTNTKSFKKNIKIGGTEKPYARVSTSTNNSNKFWINYKIKEANAEVKKNATRRRVVVAKSNIQCDPN